MVAAWILLEKSSAAIFGAPLVGALTSRMINKEESGEMPDHEKAQALAWNLFRLSSLFWGLCAFFWLMMGRALLNGGDASLANSAHASVHGKVTQAGGIPSTIVGGRIADYQLETPIGISKWKEGDGPLCRKV